MNVFAGSLFLVAFVPLSVSCGDSGDGAADTIGDAVADSAADGAADAVADTVADAAPDAATDAVTDASVDGDAVTPVACDPYPLELRGDATARTRAEAALAALAPAATLDWDDGRGTLKSVLHLDLPLTDCVGTQNVFDHAWAKVLATPDLFQLDKSEWQLPAPVPCSAVTADPMLLNFGRATLGGQPVLKDIFVFILAKKDGLVTLTGVSGFYLPKSTPALTALLASCPELDTAQALAAVAKTPLPFAKFFQCQPTGDGTYTAHADDTLEFDEAAAWSWDDAPGTGGVHLVKNHAARLIVAEANRSADLMASDANCPAEPPDPGRVVGFRITFDAVTGELLFSLPGVGCIVC
ncbi:MAG: hypothetical protein U1F43_17125 [Myxococcota bacterium]